MSTTLILPTGRRVTLDRVNSKGRENSRYDVYTDGQRIGAVASGHRDGHKGGGLFWRTTNSATALRTRSFAIDSLLTDHDAGTITGSATATVIA